MSQEILYIFIIRKKPTTAQYIQGGDPFKGYFFIYDC